jgi:hypothetical protein
MLMEDLQAMVAKPISAEKKTQAPHQVWQMLDGEASPDPDS